MVYLLLVIVIVGINDILYLKSRNKKDLYIYLILMLLISAFGIFYYTNPEKDSFAKIMLSLTGKKD